MLGTTFTRSTITWNLRTIGEWISSIATVGQPHLLNIDSSVKAEGKSSFVVKVRKNIDSSTTGLPDRKMQVHIVYTYDQGTTRAELQALKDQAVGLLTDADVDGYMRGERI